MSKIKNEIFFFFSKKFLFSQLIVVQLIICFTVCMFSICFENSSRKGTIEFQEKFVDTSYYTLCENFISDDGDFLRSEDSIKKLKLFYERVKEYEEFDYAETYENPVAFKDFCGDDKFYYGYEYGKIRKKDNMSTLKNIWCGFDVKDIFQLKLSEGNWFDEECFSGSYSSYIPIILGTS